MDFSRELLEKEVVNKFVPRVIQRIAAKASAEVVEKWAGRVIPLASSVIGAGLNYWFVRAWGERARTHFRAAASACCASERHCAHRGQYEPSSAERRRTSDPTLRVRQQLAPAYGAARDRAHKTAGRTRLPTCRWQFGASVCDTKIRNAYFLLRSHSV